MAFNKEEQKSQPQRPMPGGASDVQKKEAGKQAAKKDFPETEASDESEDSGAGCSSKTGGDSCSKN